MTRLCPPDEAVRLLMLLLVLTCIATCGCTPNPEAPDPWKEPDMSAWFPETVNHHVRRYMNLDDREADRLARLSYEHLLSIEPIVLPEPGTPGGRLPARGGMRHFGWPVAAMHGDVMVVGFKVSGRKHCIVRSTDAGRTWQAPVELSDYRRHKTTWGPGMISLGTTGDGRFILACGLGVFVSSDDGETWTHLDARLGPKGRFANAGPRVIDHPRWGWMVPYHRKGDDGFALCFFVSADEGATWEDIGPVSPAGLYPAEPTLFMHGGKLGIVTRNHSGYPMPKDRQVGYMRRWNYIAQLVPGQQDAEHLQDANFQARLTNIHMRRMDTLDVIYNPVSRRIEAVVSKRNEGYPWLDNGHQTLSLWSIDPEAFFKENEATWRFECVLLRLGDMFSGTEDPRNPPRDGLHPGGSVIDTERGLQHIVVYSGTCSHIYGHGHKPRPSNPPDRTTGIFRLTRSLHTDRLRRLALKDGPVARALPLHETFADLKGWTPSGRPVALELTDNKDLTRRTTTPLPGPGPSTGPDGLRWTTDRPGHYGLYNETVRVPDHYRLTLTARVRRWATGADTLGLSVVRGARKHYLVLRDDGIYDLPDPDKPPRRVARLQMDNNEHEWTLTVTPEAAVVRRDGREVGHLQATFEALPGRDDAPLGLFIRTTAGSGPASVEIRRLTFEPLEGH